MATIILFVFALIIRLVGASQSFWLDEATFIDLASLPLSQFFISIQDNFHPPLFYILLHFWLPLAGRSEWLIRLPNILIGAASIPVLFLFIKRLLPKEKLLPYFAAILLAISPLHVYYSTELRMYILNALLSLLSWYFLVGAIKSKTNNNWYLFTLTSVANLYTFYGFFFNLFAQWLYLIFKEKKAMKPFAVCNGLIALSFLPWLPTFVSQLKGGEYLQSVLPSWADLSGTLSPKSLGLIMAKFTFGRISLANKNAYTLFVVGISLYFLFASILAWTKKEYRLLLIWFYGALGAAIGLSLFTPVLGYWRYVFLLPAFVSVIVLGLSVLPKDAFYFNLAIVALVFLFGLAIYWTTPSFQREDWKAAAALITSQDSLTIVNFPDPFAPLRFYAPSSYYYPSQESLGQIRPDLDQTLPLILKDHQVVYVMDYLSDLTDRKRTILLWLKQAGMIEKQVHDIPGVGFVYEFTAP